MALSLQPHYYPAVCRKCGDVTQCLRSPLMRSIKVGQCGVRQRNGSPCRGDVYFVEHPLPIKKQKPAQPIVVGGNALSDLIDRKERPYPLTDEEVQKQRPNFAVNDLPAEEIAQLDQLGQQDSWGTEGDFEVA